MAEPACTWPRRTGMRRRWKSQSTALAALVAMSPVIAGMTGCALSQPQVTTAAPPTVVCGTVLNNSAAGAIVFDATRRLPTIIGTTVGGLLLFRVARGCDKGAHVTWTPSSAAHLVKAAYARNGQPAAVVLKPSGPRAAFRLIATQSNKIVAAATVKLAWAPDAIPPRSASSAAGHLPGLRSGRARSG
jgi:hypothetical protein